MAKEYKNNRNSPEDGDKQPRELTQNEFDQRLRNGLNEPQPTPQEYADRLRHGFEQDSPSPDELVPPEEFERLHNGMNAPDPQFGVWSWYKTGDFFKPWEQTADADAARMMRRHASNLLYVKRGKGFPYLLACASETGVWERDPAYVDKLLAETRIKWTQDAAAVGLDQKEFVAIAKWHTRGANRVHRDKTLGSAGRVFLDWEELGIVPPELMKCREADLDSNRRYLGAPNGVIDLDTGELLTGHAARSALVTRRVPDAFDPTAQHDDVDRIFEHLAETERNYILDAVAYAVRRGPARRIYVLLGPPRGGKSTALAAITAAFGGKETGYAMSIDGGTLVKARHNRPHGHQGGLFGIQDVLICSTSELPEGRERLNAGMLKQLDGIQPVSHREVGEKAGDSRPAKGTIFIALNASEIMRLYVSEEGFKDRIKILPYPPLSGPLSDEFTERVTKDPRARQAMVAKIVRRTAAVNGMTTPPSDPPSVTNAVEERWIDSVGMLGGWLKENVVKADGHHLFISDLMEAVGQAIPPEDDRFAGRTKAGVLSLAADICGLEPGVLKRDPRRDNDKHRAYLGFRLLSIELDESCKFCGNPFLAETGDAENAVCRNCADHADNDSGQMALETGT